MKAPLSGRVRNGRLYGRGSYDMKGGVAACLAAVKSLVDGVRCSPATSSSSGPQTKKWRARG